MKEYMVLSQKDKWFSGKFDPFKLQQALNSYAQQGWRVVTTATADIPGFGGNREELIIIMERDLDDNYDNNYDGQPVYVEEGYSNNNYNDGMSFQCPNCGNIVNGSDRACTRCGALFR